MRFEQELKKYRERLRKNRDQHRLDANRIKNMEKVIEEWRRKYYKATDNWKEGFYLWLKKKIGGDFK